VTNITIKPEYVYAVEVFSPTNEIQGWGNQILYCSSPIVDVTLKLKMHLDEAQKLYETLIPRAKNYSSAPGFMSLNTDTEVAYNEAMKVIK